MTLDRSCVSPNLRVVVGAPRADGVVICDEWHAQRLGLGSLGDSVALIDAVDRYEPQADVPVSILTTVPEQLLGLIDGSVSAIGTTTITVVTDAPSFQALLEVVLHDSRVMLDLVWWGEEGLHGMRLRRPSSEGLPASVFMEGMALGARLGGGRGGDGGNRRDPDEQAVLREKVLSLLDLLEELYGGIRAVTASQDSASSGLARTQAELDATRRELQVVQRRHEALASSHLGRLTRTYWRARKKLGRGAR